MTQFHSDEYVDFLSRISPINMNSFIKEQHKCPSHIHMRILHLPDVAHIYPEQTTLGTIALCSMAYLSIVPSPLVAPWVV